MRIFQTILILASISLISGCHKKEGGTVENTAGAPKFTGGTSTDKPTCHGKYCPNNK